MGCKTNRLSWDATFPADQGEQINSRREGLQVWVGSLAVSALKKTVGHVRAPAHPCGSLPAEETSPLPVLARPAAASVSDSAWLSFLIPPLKGAGFFLPALALEIAPRI